jgi:hypothetical protein
MALFDPCRKPPSGIRLDCCRIFVLFIILLQNSSSLYCELLPCVGWTLAGIFPFTDISSSSRKVWRNAKNFRASSHFVLLSIWSDRKTYVSQRYSLPDWQTCTLNIKLCILRIYCMWILDPVTLLDSLLCLCPFAVRYLLDTR